MDILKKALNGGILLSVFSFEELTESIYYGSIYYDNECSENNVHALLRIDAMLKNILYARSKHPLNDGVGYLYLHEVYEKLGLKYVGDRNIGITTETGYNWHNLYNSDT